MAQRLAFFYQGVAVAHHGLVDLVENLRSKQAQIVAELLQAVGRLIGPVAVAEELAHGVVLIGQLVQAVVVGIDAQAQYAKHQNLPLLHAGAAIVRGDGVAVRIAGNDLLQGLEHFSA